MPSLTKRIVLWIAAGVAALGAVAALASLGREPRPRHVFLIAVDTLRPDHMGMYGYPRPTTPHLDVRALAEDGSPRAAIFERAYSTSSWTLPAFASMFTGQLPSRHGAGILPASDPGDWPGRTRGEEEAPEAGDDPSEGPETPGAGDDDSEGPGGDDDPSVGPRAARLLVEQHGRQFTRLDATLPTLAEVLADAGFATGAVVNNPFLRAKFGVAKGFAHYDRRPNRDGPVRRADESVDAALTWVEATLGAAGAAGQEAAGREDPRLFLFLHLMDPHMPYDPPAETRGTIAMYRRRFGYPGDDLERHRELRRAVSAGNLAARSFYTAVYDEEIVHVDRHVDRFLARLDDLGILDDSLVVLVSDHGEGLFQHGNWEHGGSFLDGVVRVPLVVWGPGVRGARIEAPVSVADVMPTVLDAVGVGLPEVESADAAGEPYGLSLLPLLRADAGGLFGGDLFGGVLGAATAWVPGIGAAEPVELAESIGLTGRDIVVEGALYGRDRRALIRWPYKVIQYDDGDRLLFDLEADPLERADLHAVRAELATELAAALDERVARAVMYRSQTQGVVLDERSLDALRALGYVE